jgi:hypothetical protein
MSTKILTHLVFETECLTHFAHFSEMSNTLLRGLEIYSVVKTKREI